MNKDQPCTRSHAGYTDSERLDFLEQDVAEEPLCIHNLPVGEKVPCRGLGLKPTGRTLRQALDQIMSANGIKPSTPPSETKPSLFHIPEANELAAMAADAARWRALKEMAGYYQDGSQTTVKLYQDDALRSCFIEAGGKTYGTDGSSFNSAIDAYRKEQANG